MKTEHRQIRSLKKLNVICWSVLLCFLLLPIGMLLANSIKSGKLLERERDFILFYSAGKILNHYPADQLYNFELQKKVCMEVHPLQGIEYTPIPYPPYVAMFFQPFAELGFTPAYLLWQAISLALFISGLAVVTRWFLPGEPLRQSLVYCFAFGFFPFLWIMYGGQIPTIGFFGLAIAIREENRGRNFLSGLALSLCLYKPTLFVLIGPMLLISRRYGTLAGLTTGGAALAALSTARLGVSIWPAYVRLLLNFGADSTHTHGYRQLRYYMDLPAFSGMLAGARTLPGMLMIGIPACIALALLIRMWWLSAEQGSLPRNVAWAATITFTFVLNAYAPLYDTSIAIIGVVITVGVLLRCPNSTLWNSFSTTWLIIFGLSWFTIAIADATGVQLFTLLFGVLGILQIRTFHWTLRGAQRYSSAAPCVATL